MPAWPAALPDLFTNLAGDPVTTPEAWEGRRAEIRHMLQERVYGFLPAELTMSVRVVKEAPVTGGTFRDVRLTFPGAPRDVREIKLALFLPRSARRRDGVPVFLIINKCGNQTVTTVRAVPASGEGYLHAKGCIDDEARPLPRGHDAAAYPIRTLLRRGYGFATLAASDVAPDSPEYPRVGVRSWIPATHQDPRRSWGTLMSWAWGLSRAVDYLADAPGVRADGIIAVGHSRRGKAALLAAAFDGRVSAVIAHQSGLGGTALMRGAKEEKRETAEMMTHGWWGYPLIGEPWGLKHFFSAAFKDDSPRPDELPYDSHFLVSLVAPRPMLDSQGTRDAWAGPASATSALAAATPAWTLFGAPGPEQKFQDKGHSLTTADWNLFLEFADRRVR